MSEDIARRFHEAYERLAPQFGYETRQETREFDPTSPNGKLMIAVCREVFDRSTVGLRVEIVARRREIEILRYYGNKDCTAMADEAMEREMVEQEDATPGPYTRVPANRCPDCEFFGGSHDVDCPRRG